ncbi:MAG TPA: helix-hairpin-helix domain-containing protein [bacterium]
MLGFTKREQGVILFLCSCFVAGLGIQTVQRRWASLPDISEDITEPIQLSNTAAMTAPSAPLIVALNSADSTWLEQLPGVGPIMAKRIIDYREKHGAFRTPEDLMNVKGIGRKTFEKIKPFVRCE